MLIAEIGMNYCGDMKLARTLIRNAKQYGADLAKFQLFDSMKVHGKPMPELSKEQAFKLFNYGKEQGIEVFFSAFDVERVKWCEEMGVTRYKVANSKSRDGDFIWEVALKGKPIIISGLPFCFPSHTFEFYFLHCVPSYPADFSQLGLNNIRFSNNNIAGQASYAGYSDHTIGLNACKIAIARGAKIIEKHFAIGHSVGPDAPWSMTSEELWVLRRFYDTVQKAL